ncbi:polysaccharide deacetylase family protein [Peribacillus sp. SCS-37]|uniref:polysaccharide deacetylase family protein n=1 Tax=Paraperibacillus esterisolvens TaxID=3115296 RepID=UPI0039067082
MAKKLLLCILLLFTASGCGQKQKAEPAAGENVKKASGEKGGEAPSGKEEKPPAQESEGMSERQDEEDSDGKPKETAVQAASKYRVNPNDWSIIPLKDAAKKVALLTIDDAPDKYAVEMAAILKEKGVHAIFFVNGHFIKTGEGKAKLKKIHDLGFTIGNHTYDHVNLKEISEEEQSRQIISLNDEIEKIIGERPKFFRAPFGANTSHSRQVASNEKMIVMNWTYGYDWEASYQNSPALTNIMVNSPLLRDGANLLMHDRQWTKEALPGIIDGLRKRGFGIVDPREIEVME